MESDLGTFLPSGLQFTGSDEARAIVEEVMRLLQPVNVTRVFRAGEGTDINFWIQAGVPGKTKRRRRCSSGTATGPKRRGSNTPGSTGRPLTARKPEARSIKHNRMVSRLGIIIFICVH